MKNEYKPIDCNFYDVILEKATRKEYCKIQYFTDIHEFISTNAIIKDVFTQSGEEFMLLATDETIRLDRLVSINGMLSPTYANINDFSCSR